jgi:hypothetical protein
MLDIAKRLIDNGFHPPTIYFPLIVEECMLVEPTETESLETLDAFAEALIEIAARRTPTRAVREAPARRAVRRLDEATAARQPDLRWRPMTGRPRSIAGSGVGEGLGVGSGVGWTVTATVGNGVNEGVTGGNSTFDPPTASSVGAGVANGVGAGAPGSSP